LTGLIICQTLAVMMMFPYCISCVSRRCLLDRSYALTSVLLLTYARSTIYIFACSVKFLGTNESIVQIRENNVVLASSYVHTNQLGRNNNLFFSLKKKKHLKYLYGYWRKLTSRFPITSDVTGSQLTSYCCFHAGFTSDRSPLTIGWR
jgi:hypothetical protein